MRENRRERERERRGKDEKPKNEGREKERNWEREWEGGRKRKRWILTLRSLASSFSLRRASKRTPCWVHGTAFQKDANVSFYGQNTVENIVSEYLVVLKPPDSNTLRPQHTLLFPKSSITFLLSYILSNLARLVSFILHQRQRLEVTKYKYSK